MTIEYDDSFTLAEGTGVSYYKKINSGKFKVWVTYASGASGTVEPKMAYDADDADGLHPVEMIDGTQLSITANKVFDISGPGFLTFNCTSISGTVTIFVQQAADNCGM